MDGRRGRRRPEKRWMDCATNYNMLEKEVDDAMTANRGEWKKMTYSADPK